MRTTQAQRVSANIVQHAEGTARPSAAAAPKIEGLEKAALATRAPQAGKDGLRGRRPSMTAAQLLAANNNGAASPAELAARHAEDIGKVITAANAKDGMTTMGALYIARRLHPASDLSGMTAEQLMALPIPNSRANAVSINGVALDPPKTIGDLESFVATMHERINASKDTFTLSCNGRSLKGNVLALGQGNQGIAFDMGDSVMKLPRPNIAAIASLLVEELPAKFWQAQATRHASFAVTERLDTHPFGLFTVSEKDHGEPMSHMLLRDGIMQVHEGRVELVADRSKWKTAPTELRKVEDAIAAFVSVMDGSPVMSLSISPNNVHVTFADAEKTVIDRITLLDFGPFLERLIPSEKATPAYFAATLPQYVNEAPKELTGTPGFASVELAGHSFVAFNEYTTGNTLGSFLRVSERKIDKYLSRGYIHPDLQPYAMAYHGDIATKKKSLDAIRDQLQTGDIIGISLRSGATPMILQATTESPFDHVGLVVRDGGRPWIYQFTNTAQAHRISLESFIEHNRDEKGQLRYVHVRPKEELTEEKRAQLKDSATKLLDGSLDPDSLITKTLPVPVRSCTQFVRAAFETIGRTPGRFTTTDELQMDAFGGFIGGMWKKILPSHDHLITPVSILGEGHTVKHHNFENDPFQWTREDTARAWAFGPNVEKISRLYATLHLRRRDMSPDAQQELFRRTVAAYGLVSGDA